MRLLPEAPHSMMHGAPVGFLLEPKGGRPGNRLGGARPPQRDRREQVRGHDGFAEKLLPLHPDAGGVGGGHGGVPLHHRTHPQRQLRGELPGGHLYGDRRVPEDHHVRERGLRGDHVHHRGELTSR